MCVEDTIVGVTSWFFPYRSFPNYEIIDLTWNYINRTGSLKASELVSCQDIPELSEKIESFSIGEFVSVCNGVWFYFSSYIDNNTLSFSGPAL